MTYYEILEVTENASEEVIKAAYKTQAAKYHPDNKKTGDEKKMQMLNIAYEILSDPDKRKQYDNTLHHNEKQKYEDDKNVNYKEKKSEDVDRSESNAEELSRKSNMQQEKTHSIYEKKLGIFFRFPILLFLACLPFPFSLISLFLLIIRYMKLKNNYEYVDRIKKMKRTKFYIVILILVIISSSGCGSSEKSNKKNNIKEQNISINTEDIEKETKISKKENSEKKDKENEDKSKKKTKEAKKKKDDNVKKENKEKNSESQVKDKQVVESKGITNKNDNMDENVDNADEYIMQDAEIIADGLYSSYYPTYIVLQYDENMIFNKNKKMKLYLDDNFVVELVQGDEKVYGIMLQEGNHNIKIQSGWFNSKKIDFKVGEYEFYDLKIDNIFYMKIGYKYGDPKIMEFYGTNTPEDGEDIAEINEEAGSNALYAFYTNSYEPIGNFEEVFEIFSEKYGFEDTDVYKTLEDSGILDEY